MMPYNIPAPIAAKVGLSALGFRFLPGHHPVGIDLDRAQPDVGLRGFAIKHHHAHLILAGEQVQARFQGCAGLAVEIVLADGAQVQDGIVGRAIRVVA